MSSGSNRIGTVARAMVPELEEREALRCAPPWAAELAPGFNGLVATLLDDRRPTFNFDAEAREGPPVPLEGGLDVSWRRAREVFIFGFFRGVAVLSFTSTRGPLRD